MPSHGSSTADIASSLTSGQAIDAEVMGMLIDFYMSSDSPQQNQAWVDQFTNDAEVTIGNRQSRGRDELRELRAMMWSRIVERRHRLSRIFPGSPKHTSELEPPELELMLFGDVELYFDDGTETLTSWAGHAILKKVDVGDAKKWRFSYYHVWLGPPNGSA